MGLRYCRGGRVKGRPVLNNLVVPESLRFAELCLEREPVTCRLLFAPAPLTKLCPANGLDPAAILADEDLSCWLIAEWYCAHREAGGEPDPVAEQILVEVAASEASGIAVLRPGFGLPN